MLQVSDAAVEALEAARDAQELPETYGVRVFGQPTDDGQIAVALAFADVPLENDAVAEDART